MPTGTVRNNLLGTAVLPALGRRDRLVASRLPVKVTESESVFSGHPCLAHGVATEITVHCSLGVGLLMNDTLSL